MLLYISRTEIRTQSPKLHIPSAVSTSTSLCVFIEHFLLVWDPPSTGDASLNVTGTVCPLELISCVCVGGGRRRRGSDTQMRMDVEKVLG